MGRIAVIAMMVGKMLMLVSICDSAFGNIGWDEGKTVLLRLLSNTVFEIRHIDVDDRLAVLMLVTVYC